MLRRFMYSISAKCQNKSYLQRNYDEETIFSIKKVVVVHSLSLISLKVLTVHIVCNFEKLLLSISRTDIYHTCYKEMNNNIQHRRIIPCKAQHTTMIIL